METMEWAQLSCMHLHVRGMSINPYDSVTSVIQDVPSVQNLTLCQQLHVREEWKNLWGNLTPPHIGRVCVCWALAVYMLQIMQSCSFISMKKDQEWNIWWCLEPLQYCLCFPNSSPCRYSMVMAMGYLTVCQVSRVFIFNYGILSTDFSG